MRFHHIPRHFPLRPVLCAAGLLLTGGSRAEVFAFVAMPLTGTQQVSPVATSGSGTITALYDSSSRLLTYAAVFQLQANATASAAHFHGPAGLGENAGVAVAVSGLPAANAGKTTGSVTLTAQQEADLLAGRWYFNIHSDQAPDGELRGQMIENSASAVLPVYASSTATLTLPVVTVPGIGVYSGTMGYGGGNQFMLNSAAAIR